MSTTVQVILDEGYKVRAHTATHVLIADEPIDLGCTDLGPAPYELLLSSLGACTVITMRMYATRKGIPMEGVQVELSHEKVYRKDCEECTDDRPGTQKIDRITRSIRMTGPMTDEQRAKMLEIAGKCPVHQTLKSSTLIHDELV
jgi:putative redox protein